MKRRLINWLGYFDSAKTIHAIVIAGLAARLAEIAAFSRLGLHGDDLIYDGFARALLHHGTIDPLGPPGVVYYLEFFYRIFGASPAVARICILLFYPAFAYLLYALIKKLSNRKAANLTVLFFSLYPSYIILSIEPITEMPATVLLLVATGLLLRLSRRAAWGDMTLLGVDLGCLTLTRPSCMLLVITVPIYLWVKTRRPWFSVLPLLLAGLLVGSWIIRLYQRTGHFLIINYSSSQNVFLGNNPYTPLYATWWFASHTEGEVGVPEGFVKMNRKILRQPWFVQNTLYRQIAVRSILSRPDLFLVRTFSRIRVYFAFDSYTGSLLLNRYHQSRALAFETIAGDAFFYCTVMLLAILLLFTLTKKSESTKPALMITGISLLYAAPYWLAVSHPIYHFPVVPLFGILGAMLIGDLTERPVRLVLQPLYSSARRRRWLVASLVVFAYIQVEFACFMYVYSNH